jgi:aminobenzoyl-glutamate utilization protein B
MYDIIFRFHGSSSHAGAAPHMGRSALDAVELMNVGVNYLREHVPPDVRMHYVIIDGGKAPNIVPQDAAVWYCLRARLPETLRDVRERVENIAKGAAIMTGTKVEILFKSGVSNLLNNKGMSDLQYENMKSIGPINFTQEEIAFAERINSAYPANTCVTLSTGYCIPSELLCGNALIPDNFPALDEGQCMSFSTDVGDLSWRTPLSLLMTACIPTNASLHTWGATAAAGMSIGHKGMLHAAKIMALSAIDLFTDPERLKPIRKEFDDALKAHPYQCPIPLELKPPVYFNPCRNRINE